MMLHHNNPKQRATPPTAKLEFDAAQPVAECISENPTAAIEFTDFVLNRLRVAFIRAQLNQNEIAALHTGLRGGFIDPSSMVC